MQMTQPLRSGVAGWLRGTTFNPLAGVVQLALSTTDPTYDASGVSEPSGGGYARKDVLFGDPTQIANVQSRSSISQVIFEATADWGTITHAVLYRGTEAYWQGTLNAQKLVNSGDSLSFAVGDIELTAGLRWSTYSRDLILNTVTGGALQGLGQLYLALSTADPTETGAGISEPSGMYARQGISLNETANEPTGIVVSNPNAVVYGPATGNWGNISHMAIYDAVTGGNMVAYGPVAVQRNVVSGDAYAVSTNSLALTIR